jgi:hypothetical protein
MHKLGLGCSEAEDGGSLRNKPRGFRVQGALQVALCTRGGFGVRPAGVRRGAAKCILTHTLASTLKPYESQSYKGKRG